MAYTPFFTYVNGDTIGASSLRINMSRLRNYINSGVVLSDIDSESIDTPEVVTGEPIVFSGDYQFTTGNQYNQFVDNEDINRDYFTGQTKSVDASSYSMWWTLSETGKKVTLERDGRILIHAGIDISCEENYAMDYDDDGSLDSDGLGSRVLLRINGNNYYVTTFWAFEECAAPGPALTGGSGNRRYYPISYLTDELSAGEYEISFAIDPVVDLGSVRARNVTIECFWA